MARDRIHGRLRQMRRKAFDRARIHERRRRAVHACDRFGQPESVGYIVIEPYDVVAGYWITRVEGRDLLSQSDNLLA